MGRIELSIVVPTKNRAEKLDSALTSIVKQKVCQDCFEVIVIDNGSTDNTVDCVRTYQDKIKNLRYIYDARPGLHVGRNRGILESRGEVIGFLDDDEILFPNWIDTVLNAFADKEVMAVCGSLIPYDFSVITAEFKKRYVIKRESFRFAYPISCYWEQGLDENDKRVHRAKRGMLLGGSTVYRRKILRECQGFHPDSMPPELMMYRGDGESHVENFIFEKSMKIMYYAQASVYHQIDASRISKEYLSYMFFRNGISHMYTCLRSEGLRGGLKHILHNLSPTKLTSMSGFHLLRGNFYLFLYYLFYGNIRRWVHKKNYF